MNSEIAYQIEPNLPVSDFIGVLQSSTLAERRPINDIPRMDRMLRQADLILTARYQGELVGIARTLTDGSYSTYLADLAVAAPFQGRGIGRELIRRTHAEAGLQTNLILIAAPGARTYYPHIGMAHHDSCWMIRGEAPTQSPSQS
ncbi:GNAT family N-acetyltransferase [Prosthecobacter dejongeii]|uniref:Putative N-acetyltransferase YhbS n=1 Tax=Prosthecobacter dejongeii TaxID=48465 RepID=A0A7W8DRS5_9BACT|nr:GNAT family N-acetyltransferase [Prosthecobacter dejongeii]MBB5039737.1 putative N-acetyltransferase YhbS [Prosthecobacter dejongeii]